MKFRGGSVVGQASGSVAGQTFSHNRYGAYVRNRSIPVVSTTSYALNAKSYLAGASAAWKALTAAQQAAWVTWAQTNPIVDSFGEKQVLTGHAAYVQLNRRILQDGGTQIDVPPVGAGPVSLITLTATFDIGLGTFALAFTPTPIGATNKLWIKAAVVNSLGITYVRNLLKLVKISAANVATGLDTEADIELRFGPLAAGQKVVFYVAVYQPASGLLSGYSRVDGTVVST